MDALPSLTRLSVGAGTSKDDALPTFAELDALDADETAAPPRSNDMALWNATRSPELWKSYDYWKAGKPNPDEVLSEVQKWEYKWYGDPEVLQKRFPWNRREVETGGFFDWAPSFWYNFKLVREQESLFAKAGLCYSDGNPTGRETFMHPASSVFDVIQRQLHPAVWQRMLTEGAWIVDFSNMDTPNRQCRREWEHAYTEAERYGGPGRGVVIAVVKPASLRPFLFHHMLETNGFIRDYEGQDPEDDGYERIRNLLLPLATSAHHIFLVVVETWPEEGYEERTVTLPDGSRRDEKWCAFYKPDEYTEPQLQERGRQGLAWPKTEASETAPDEYLKEDAPPRRERIDRERRAPPYRDGRYFPLDDREYADKAWRENDVAKQEAAVANLQQFSTDLQHAFCEYDDALCIMLRLWLQRKASNDPPSLEEMSDHLRYPGSRTQGVLTTDRQMYRLCNEQTLRAVHEEYFKFNDVFRLRVFRATSQDERKKRAEADLKRQYSVREDRKWSEAKKSESVKLTMANKEAIDEQLQARKQAKNDLAGQIQGLKRRLEREATRLEVVLEWEKSAIREEMATLTRRLRLLEDEYDYQYRKFPEYWEKEDRKYPVKYRHTPQEMLEVQNEEIGEPRSIYSSGTLPEVLMGTEEARKYLHDRENVFAPIRAELFGSRWDGLIGEVEREDEPIRDRVREEDLERKREIEERYVALRKS